MAPGLSAAGGIRRENGPALVELRQQVGSIGPERRELGAPQRFRIRQRYLAGVEVDAVLAVFIVQMSGSGETRRADVADDFALPDP